MATLSRMMKKVASSIIPLANRSPHRNYTSTIFTTPLKTSTTISSVTSSSNLFRTISIPIHHHFSALAKKRYDFDDNLLRVIESKIDDVVEEALDLEIAEAPKEFTFKIVDNAGEGIITLTRDYQGEEIQVTVLKPDLSDDQEVDQNNEEKEEESGWCVDLVVSVKKKIGPTLEFLVMVEADGITIDNLDYKNPNVSDEAIAYEGPEFKGINSSTANFLFDYMVNKEHKEYTVETEI
ncbi:hypothetical protein MKX01_042844 [Papaver californicum]|nr:hypothetical protein MKX01_042844 [Papaver californicum]